MRKFKINVNGNSYEVEVEEIACESGAVVSAPVAPTPVAAAPKAAPKAAAPAGKGTKLVSPLPGAVLKFSAQNGAKVKTNDVVLIIEAMKMENEIRATADGVITFAVNTGATVQSGDVLAYIA